jgi:Uma2 family endonuclease
MVPRIHDYLDAGVEWIWVIDPYDRTALIYSKQDPSGNAATVLRTVNPVIEIPLESVLTAQE